MQAQTSRHSRRLLQTACWELKPKLARNAKIRPRELRVEIMLDCPQCLLNAPSFAVNHRSAFPR